MDIFDRIEKDVEATPAAKHNARRVKADAKKTKSKVVKEWYEILGDNICLKTRLSNGNVYSRHLCKATKVNIAKLKKDNIEIKGI
jgi:hypothetical protein